MTSWAAVRVGDACVYVGSWMTMSTHANSTTHDPPGAGGGGRKGKGGKGVAGPAQVLLVSIKAGGTGLNLTGANHCIICEPFFNPAVEDQVRGQPQQQTLLLQQHLSHFNAIHSIT